MRSGRTSCRRAGSVRACFLQPGILPQASLSKLLVRPGGWTADDLLEFSSVAAGAAGGTSRLQCPGITKRTGAQEVTRKHTFQSPGFTLIELLLVMAILGILAAMLLAATARVQSKTKVQRARVEIDQIVTAIMEYDVTYGRFPVSPQVRGLTATSDEDVTYGGVIEETGTWIAGPERYRTNNAEVMAPLLDLDCYGDGARTINQGHVLNPRRIRFLEAALVGGTNAIPGVGIDGIYRDPWGCPYVITLDLNADGRARDFFYREPTVSEDRQNAGRGLNGLVRNLDRNSNVVFEASVPVMVWSAGPDRHLDSTVKANEGVNRDNVLSWKK